MNKKKPDALLILAVLFGLGVLISTISHGDSDEAGYPEQAVGSMNISMYQSVPVIQD